MNLCWRAGTTNTVAGSYRNYFYAAVAGSTAGVRCWCGNATLTPRSATGNRDCHAKLIEEAGYPGTSRQRCNGPIPGVDNSLNTCGGVSVLSRAALCEVIVIFIPLSPYAVRRLTDACNQYNGSIVYMRSDFTGQAYYDESVAQTSYPWNLNDTFTNNPNGYGFHS